MILRNFVKRAIMGYRKILVKKGIIAQPIPEGEIIEKVTRKEMPIGEEKIPIQPKGVRIERVVERIERKEEEIKIEGIEIPKSVKRRVRLIEKKEEKLETISIYPLIPLKPKKNETIFAYVKIYFDPTYHRFIYEVIEPKMTERLKTIFGKIKELLEQRLDVDFTKLKKIEATEYLNKQMEDLINYFGFELSEEEKKILRYYMERDFIGFGKIEPLMRDPNIEDISCDGVGIPIFVFHRDPKLGSLMTNIVFETNEELDSFVIRLAQLAGKSISVASPLLDGSLPDGSRVQATLATDIARRGSNFTIRKFTKTPLTPTHLLNFNTISEIPLAYLWLAVDYGRSILVSGGTATGKTTFLNILSLFIRPEKKIVSIEDTAELHLPHTHWVPSVARTVIAQRPGEIDLFELLRESLRQRPDYIIVGEVRGKEAYILFQQIATGHPALATIHAENLKKLADRLITAPISLPPALIGSLDIIVFMASMRYKGRFVRRVKEILEMVRFDPVKKIPIVNRVFKWNPINDEVEVVGKSYVLKKICEQTGMSEEKIIEELNRRALILRWMREKGIEDFREIHKIFSVYYTYPNKLLARIMREI